MIDILVAGASDKVRHVQGTTAFLDKRERQKAMKATCMFSLEILKLEEDVQLIDKIASVASHVK